MKTINNDSHEHALEPVPRPRKIPFEFPGRFTIPSTTLGISGFVRCRMPTCSAAFATARRMS